MTTKERLIEKYKVLANKRPLGVDLMDIDPVQLFNETQENVSLKAKLNRFGKFL
jgi:hypothetical protein